jgi:GNAT superfamily N-acetyltransferase
MQEIKTVIRLLERQDISQIAEAFQRLGWDKPAAQYERYFDEQEQDARRVYVAFVELEFAGYLTICWTSDYEPFREEHIPEIVDFNVLPEFRRRGIGTLLMDRAEGEIAGTHPVAGIGVGMTADYGAAQRLYVLRGYVPDGRGLHFHGHPVRYGEEVRVDDDLVLYFTKKLNST